MLVASTPARRCPRQVVRTRIRELAVAGSLLVLAAGLGADQSRRGQVSTESRTLIALQSREVESVPDCGAQELDIKNELLRRFHIVVLAIHAKCEANLEVVLKCIGPKWERVPAREKDGIVRIPTGEIFVRFKDATPPATIHSILRDNSLDILESPTRPGSAYKVAVHPLSAARSMEAVKALTQLNDVEYAEPNWIIIRAREP